MTNQGSKTLPGWWTILTLAGLVVVVGVTFVPVLRGGFVGLDDGNNIFLNPSMGALSWDRMAWAFGDLGSARRYMPLGWLGFSTVFTVQGLAPAGYHAASLGWHLVATVMLFAAVRNILRLHPRAGQANWIAGVSLLVAAVWALHPMRTEAVAWASGLLYTQASALALAALWFWTLRWSRPQQAGWFAAGSGVTLAASLLTYPIALGLPVVCWLLDLLAGRNQADTGEPRKRPARLALTRGLLGLVVVAGAVFVVTLSARWTNSANFAATASLGDFGFPERVLQALYVWGRYLVQLVWPVGLSPVYTELHAFHPLGRGVLPTVVLSGLLLAVAGWRWRTLWGPVLAYSIMALPFLGLLEHPWIAHDRYAMLLHPVLLVAGAWWLLRVNEEKTRLAVSVSVLLLGLLGAAQARALTGVWSDQGSVDGRLRQTLPRDAWAGYYLGYVPASVLFLEGRFAEIGPRLDRAEVEAPGWSAGPARGEFEGLMKQHREFMQQNWPGRSIPPLAVLHFLHGRSAQAGRDWRTARAHFQAAWRAAADFDEARQAMVRCELELRPAGP